ncbi:hypothetical protein AAV94_11155 [Lampropedia cohaerens]|uniref:NlpC/P60 domain-containing protein n=1 Tax=Lampropedia cohaerens TaxID=1610491 RepID=A0A0U1PY00_9BURK|nr:hypothetical protein [Lampropedia cohaerens]KKW67390.1 hypothetical protein AAV94_11155 [Lampropedia cohaerens]
MSVDIRKLDALVGRAHGPQYDCADLAMDAARELFGREIVLPSARPRPQGTRSQATALLRAMGELARPVAEPQDGDLVLMALKGCEIAGHVGTWLHVNYSPHVLHTSLAMGYAGLTRLDELPRYGIRVEGFYRWID